MSSNAQSLFYSGAVWPKSYILSSAIVPELRRHLQKVAWEQGLGTAGNLTTQRTVCDILAKKLGLPSVANSLDSAFTTVMSPCIKSIIGHDGAWTGRFSLSLNLPDEIHQAFKRRDGKKLNSRLLNEMLAEALNVTLSESDHDYRI